VVTVLSLPALAPAADGASAPELVAVLESGSQAERAAAVKQLRALGPAAAPALTEMLRAASFRKDGDRPADLYEARYLLLATGPRGLALVGEAANQPHQRHGAATLLIETLVRFKKGAGPYVRRLLQHDDTRLQLATLQALGNRRRHSEPFVAELVNCLKTSPLQQVRIAAAQALEKIAQYARQASQQKFSGLAAPYLLKLAAGEDRRLALAAAGALVRIEDERHENGNLAALAPQLISLLQDKDAEVRVKAARYLELTKLASAAVVDALIAAMQNDKSAEVRMVAAGALNQNAFRQTKVIAAMAQVIGDVEDLKVRPRGFYLRPVATAASLTLYNNRRASLPYLKDNLQCKNAGARYLSARLISQIDPEFETERVRGILLSRVDHANALERYNAATGLSRLGPLAAPATPALVKLLADHTVAQESDSPLYVSYVHDGAAFALGEVGPQAKAAAPALAALITSGKVANPHSLRRIYTALKKVDPGHPLTDESFLLEEAAGRFNYFVHGPYARHETTADGELTVSISFPPFKKADGFVVRSEMVTRIERANQPATSTTQQRELRLHRQGGQVLFTETVSGANGKQQSKITALLRFKNFGISMVLPPDALKAARPGDWISCSWQPMKAGGVRGFEHRKDVKEAAIWHSTRKGVR